MEKSSCRGFKEQGSASRTPLADLAESYRGIRYDFADLWQQPRRILTSPAGPALSTTAEPIAAYVMNVERLVPWRTLTGRQHLLSRSRSLPCFRRVLPYV